MAAELGGAAVSGVASKATESAYDYIRRQISYVTEYQRHIEDLKKQVEELKDARERVEHSVGYAKRQGEEIENDVERWLSSVDNFMDRQIVKPIIQNEDTAKKYCCKGLCPNLIIRYVLSKEALKAAKDGSNLLNKKNFSTVSYRPVLQKMESMYVRDYEAFDSRMSNLHDIMEALKDDNINLIGVYGMGGVGKTTLVSKVASQAMEEKLFDTVVMVEVTQTLDYKKIREKIARDLGLEFDKENEFQRADRIGDKLKEKRVLIVLDNIWEKLDLKSVGIHFGYDESKSVKQRDEQRRCKILLTSRSQDVLSNVMNTQKNFLIETLSDKEGQTLFEKIVGNIVEKTNYKPIAVKIIRKCRGLPLAIVTVANALKKKELFVWKYTLDNLEVSSSRHINGMDTNLFSTIESSYKILEGEAKTIFLLCCLYNAGYEIYIYDLLRFGIGLGLFQKIRTLEQKRNRLCTLIDHLKASCLLLEGDTKDRVKMHDIIHVVAVSIASTDEHMLNIQDVTGLKQMLEEEISKDSIAISLPFKDINELPERLEFPKLELFLLFKRDLSLQNPYFLFERIKKHLCLFIPQLIFEKTKNLTFQIPTSFFVGTEHLSFQIPDLFFTGTQQLKVLAFKGIYFPSLPSSFQHLSNLRTLSLEACRLGDIAMVGVLTKLEILSFSHSDIKQLPREIRQLTRLRFLDLSNCVKLQIIAPNVIPQLSQLEELYMGNSFVEWEAKDLNNQRPSNASLIELKELSHLTTLDIHVPDARILPQDLNFEMLERYRIFIGDVWSWRGNYETSRTLKLKLNSNISVRHGISTLLKRAEDLYLDELNGVQNVLYGLDDEGFPQLKHLHVQSGSEFLFIIHSQELTPCNAFPILESLYLYNLINLEKICHYQLTEESFGNLRIVNVQKCDRLKHLFSFSLAKNLSQLQSIQVKDCKNLTEIFSQESEDHVIHNERNNKIELSQLCSLTLDSLPQLKSFGLDMNSSLRSQTLFASDMGSTEIIAEDESLDFMALFNQKVVFPCLENLKLVSINIEMIWLNQLPVPSYNQTLTSITVEKCNGLKFLFSSSMVKCLAQLQILLIGDCKSIAEIIDTDGLRGEEKRIKIRFPKLSNLVLQSLPKLTRFGTGDFVEFPSLTDLLIENCPNLDTFFSSSSCAKIVSKEPEAMNLENCSADTCPLFDEKVAIPNLKEIILSGLDKLQMIWHHQLHDDSFCKLEVLRVEHCKKLLIIVPSNALGRLSTLKILTISNCTSLEAVSEFQGLNVVETTDAEEERISKMLFPKLKHPKLEDLPRLTCNPTGNFIELSSLFTLQIDNCPAMKSFCSNSICADRTSGKEPEEMNSEEKFHTGMQPFFDKKVRLPNLERLVIEHMDELRKIWDNQLSLDSFCKLNQLIVMSCNKLLNVFPSNMLGILHKLEFLTVQNCGSLEEIVEVLEKNSCIVEETDANKDISILSSIGTGWIRHNQMLATSSCFQNLTTLIIDGCDRFKYFFLSSEVENFVQLKEFQICNCKLIEGVIVEEKRISKMLFPKLEKLWLKDLPRLTRFWDFTGNFFELSSLLELGIENCPGMKTFISNPVCADMTSSKEPEKMNSRENLYTDIRPLFDKKVRLPSLEMLEINHMDKLRKIWDNQLSSDSFCKLNQLRVVSCSKLLNIFPSNMLGIFQKLEFLALKNCTSLEYMVEVFEKNSCIVEEIVANEETLPRFVFPKLTFLELLMLPSLKSLYPEIHISEWPVLRNLNVHGCNEVEIFASKFLSLQETDGECQQEILVQQSLFLIDKDAFPSLEELNLSMLPKLLYLWKENSPSSNSFRNLIALEVSQCHRLRYLLTHSIAKSLVQLKRMAINYCIMIETIITRLGHEVKDQIVFNQLENLKLECLPSLTSFSSGEFTLEFPSLEQVIMNQCPEMEIFSQGVLDTPRLRKVQLTEEDEGHWEGNLNITVQQLFKEMLGFRGLEYLRLSQSPRLKEKWNGQFPFPVSFFGNLKSLVVDECSYICSAIPVNLLRHLNNLQMLDVRNCDSLKEVFDLEGLNTNGTICRESYQEILCFKSLKSLQVHSCRSLRYVFTPSVVLGLVQLQNLQITNCAAMEEIIKKEGEEDGAVKIIVPQLNSIILTSLPNLRSFYSQRNILECPSLEDIKIEDCQKMETFVLTDTASLFNEKVEFPSWKNLRILSSISTEWLWNSQLPAASSCFQTLTTLIIDGCDHFKYIFSSYEVENFVQLRELQVCDCKLIEGVIVEKERKSKMLFPKLEKLLLEDLPRLTRFCEITGNFFELSFLLELSIKNCPGMKTFISNPICADMTSSEEPEKMNSKENLHTDIQPLFDKKVRLPNLEILEIGRMNELRKIWDDQLSSDSFCKLNQLWVTSCNKILNIFPNNLLGILQKLEEFIVQHCDSLEEIVEMLEKNSCIVEEIVANEESLPRFVFPKLTFLELWMLPSLKSLYPGIHISEWPMLRKLNVDGCDKVDIFASEFLSLQETRGECQQEILIQQSLFSVDKDAFPSLEELRVARLPKLLYLWKENSHPSNNFRNLTTLEVSNCGGLRYLITYSTAKSLVQLKTLFIAECESIKTVITHFGDELKDRIAFNQLEYVELCHLWSLKSFCSGEYNLEFPSLKKVIVNQCSDMEIFSRGVLNTPKLKSLQLTEDDDEGCWEGNLNSTINQLFNEWLYIPAWMNL